MAAVLIRPMSGATTVGNVNVNVDYYLRIVARASMLHASERRKRAKNTLAPAAILREHGLLHFIATSFLVKKLSRLLGCANLDSTSRSCKE